MHEQISDLLAKNQTLNGTIERNANLEKLQTETTKIISNLKLQLN